MNWAYFPRSSKPVPLALQVVEVLEKNNLAFDSATHTFESNGVLAIVANDLAGIGFRVETGKKKRSMCQSFMEITVKWERPLMPMRTMLSVAL